MLEKTPDYFLRLDRLREKIRKMQAFDMGDCTTCLAAACRKCEGSSAKDSGPEDIADYLGISGEAAADLYTGTFIPHHAHMAVANVDREMAIRAVEAAFAEAHGASPSEMLPDVNQLEIAF